MSHSTQEFSPYYNWGGGDDLPTYDNTNQIFWTKPRKQVAFASSFLLLSPLIYFEVAHPALRTHTLDLIQDYPLHSFVILALIMLQLRAIYNKYIAETNKTTTHLEAPDSYSYTYVAAEPPNKTRQNTSFWVNHKTKIVTLSIITLAVLAYFEYTNADLEKKTIELGKEYPVVLIGITLIALAALYYDHKQSKALERNSDPDQEQPGSNKFISLVKEQTPLICALGLLFAGNYAYQHWDATLDTFSKPWVAGISLGVSALVLCTVTAIIVKKVRRHYENKKKEELEAAQAPYYRNPYDALN